LGEQSHGANELVGIDPTIAVLVEVLKDEAALAVRALEVLLQRQFVQREVVARVFKFFPSQFNGAETLLELHDVPWRQVAQPI
jgi:hypothetical protein